METFLEKAFSVQYLTYNIILSYFSCKNYNCNGKVAHEQVFDGAVWKSSQGLQTSNAAVFKVLLRL